MGTLLYKLFQIVSLCLCAALFIVGSLTLLSGGERAQAYLMLGLCASVFLNVALASDMRRERRDYRLRIAQTVAPVTVRADSAVRQVDRPIMMHDGKPFDLFSVNPCTPDGVNSPA